MIIITIIIMIMIIITIIIIMIMMIIIIMIDKQCIRREDKHFHEHIEIKTNKQIKRKI